MYRICPGLLESSSGESVDDQENEEAPDAAKKQGTYAHTFIGLLGMARSRSGMRLRGAQDRFSE
jgi:hypothetical protein